MGTFILVIREFIVEILKRYAHMRKSLHFGINSAIFVAELIAAYSIHEAEIHAGILTFVFGHESIPFFFGEE